MGCALGGAAVVGGVVAAVVDLTVLVGAVAGDIAVAGFGVVAAAVAAVFDTVAAEIADVDAAAGVVSAGSFAGAETSDDSTGALAVAPNKPRSGRVLAVAGLK